MNHASIDTKSNLLPAGKNIGVIELRNYILKKGQRDAFIQYFEDNFIGSQQELGGFPFGQYRVKDFEDNFCWIRGFENMQSRSKFLPAFYYGPFWKARRSVANAMIVNNDNVHLLRPLEWQKDSLVAVPFVSSETIIPRSGIVVVDFYISNTKLQQLLGVFATRYIPLLHSCGINDMSCWVSELQENDFPALPVFQDRNLLLTFSFYKDELTYLEEQKKIESNMQEDLRADMQDAVTLHHSLILYPTKKTLEQ